MVLYVYMQQPTHTHMHSKLINSRRIKKKKKS